jgi:hypothetical protein
LLLLAVVWLAEVFVDGEGLRTILQLVAVVAGFALLVAWRWRNRIALELEKERRPTSSGRARGSSRTFSG